MKRLINMYKNDIDSASITTELPETAMYILDPIYDGPATTLPAEFGTRGNFKEKPPQIMPEYLSAGKPLPTFAGEKPRAGFPK